MRDRILLSSLADKFSNAYDRISGGDSIVPERDDNGRTLGYWFQVPGCKSEDISVESDGYNITVIAKPSFGPNNNSFKYTVTSSRFNPKDVDCSVKDGWLNLKFATSKTDPVKIKVS